MEDNLSKEVAAMLSAGCRKVSMREMRERFLALGYRLVDPCDGTSTNLTTGNRYPERTYNPEQFDGKSAFHFQARRDEKYTALKQLRNEIFAVVRGRMVTV